MTFLYPLVLLATVTSLTFCDGYRQGFTAAYCQGHQFCTSAPVPACPESDGSWKDGYDRGYDDGERVHPGHGQ